MLTASTSFTPFTSTSSASFTPSLHHRHTDRRNNFEEERVLAVPSTSSSGVVKWVNFFVSENCETGLCVVWVKF